ncbi:hypothetical protein QFZ23_000247 [Arthrobacter globiformis]|nr:hypothetical protein [Arthrobacter globiformis]MDQ1056346.1 hypothetical protein [Arthrobacter globiformis]
MDLEVVQAAAFVVEEDALAVAEGFFAGFGAVLVEGVDPAVGDAGEEVVVVFDRGVGEVVFHVGDRVGVGDVADFVQGGGDDGSGAGGDDSGGEGGGGFLVFGWHGPAGESGAGEGGVGEGEAAAGFGGADPEPGAEEFGGVPGPVIGRGPGHRTRRQAPGGGFGCGFGVPAGGPAARAAGRCGGVDRLGPRPVHRCGSKQLEVLDTAGEFLGKVSEVRRFKEVGCGQLLLRRGGCGVQQRQARLQIRGCQRRGLQSGAEAAGGIKAGGSTAVGRVLDNSVNNSVRTETGNGNAA